MDARPITLRSIRRLLAILAILAACPPPAAAWQTGIDLLVGSAFTDSVLRYDGQTGAFLGTFASGGGWSRRPE